MDNSSKKPIYTSKSIITALLTTVLPWMPGADDFINAHSDLILSLVGVAFGALRLATDKGVEFSWTKKL